MTVSNQLGDVLAPKTKDSARAPSLRELAYDTIKQKIITCELKPGEVLNEAALSASLDIGRTPVHQAIDRLVTDGLIEVMPRKGIMVKPVTLDEIFNIIEARLVNESYCARRAASHADAADITRMLENLDGTWAAAKERAIDKLMFLDRQFHGYLSSISRNDILVDILSNLHDRSARLWFISLRANEQHVRVCEQHAAIVEGIRQHDPDAAENAIRLHITSFRENLTLQI